LQGAIVILAQRNIQIGRPRVQIEPTDDVTQGNVKVLVVARDGQLGWLDVQGNPLFNASDVRIDNRDGGSLRGLSLGDGNLDFVARGVTDEIVV
jgi:hypothetical protein